MLVTITSSFALLALAFGTSLAWHARRAMAGKPSRPFEPRGAGILVALTFLSIALGQAVLDGGRLKLWVFPLLHTLAACLPPLAILAWAGRRLRGAARWRDAVLELSSGAVLSTSAAMLLELALVAGLVLVGAAVMALTSPMGETQPQMLEGLFQDPEAIAQITHSPLVWVGALLVGAVAIPLIEEATKTVGVGLLSYRRPGLAQSMLWGLACGAGFAMMESTLNGAAGLDAWAPTLLLRAGATLMHCLTGAMMGLAWYAAWQRNWRRALSLLAASMLLHGTWNALTITTALLFLGAPGDPAGAALDAGSVVGIICLALLIILTACAALGLVALTRLARAASPASPSAPEEPHAVGRQL
jgi:RsiW-degrading membrane proteinase PrsW (M82 family)